MTRFPPNEIISLVSTTPRYDLAESVGPDIRLGELLEPAQRAHLLDLPLGYGTPAGDPRLRELIAALDVEQAEALVTYGAHRVPDSISRSVRGRLSRLACSRRSLVG